MNKLIVQLGDQGTVMDAKVVDSDYVPMLGELVIAESDIEESNFWPLGSKTININDMVIYDAQ